MFLPVRVAFGIVIVAVVGIVLLAAGLVPGLNGELPMRFWVAGAGALGLVSGFTTGLSKQPGSGVEFVKFIGAGVLVPTLGGVAALLSKTQDVAEKSTYAGSQLVEKTTRTVTTFAGDLLHPLAVIGSFFMTFALFGILGIVAGALLRKSGFIDVMAA